MSKIEFWNINEKKYNQFRLCKAVFVWISSGFCCFPSWISIGKCVLMIVWEWFKLILGERVQVIWILKRNSDSCTQIFCRIYLWQILQQSFWVKKKQSSKLRYGKKDLLVYLDFWDLGNDWKVNFSWIWWW